MFNPINNGVIFSMTLDFSKIPGIQTIDCGILEKARIIEKITPLLIGLNIKYKSHYGGLRITGIPQFAK